MKEYNFVLQLYFTDDRNFAEARQLIVEALHCPLRVDETDTEIDQSVYHGRILGIDIYFEKAGQYGDGKLYYLTGGSAAYLFNTGAPTVALDQHVKQILYHRGIRNFPSPADVASKHNKSK